MLIKSIAVVIYGFLILAGGTMGYIKHQSVASIGMAGGFATLLFGSAWAMFYENKAAFYSAVGLVVMLMLFFSYRFYMKQQFMPPGMIAVLSLIMLAILLIPIRNSEL